jgi:hypothetical protein
MTRVPGFEALGAILAVFGIAGIKISCHIKYRNK